MRDEDIVFYDIECTKYDSLVILKDINNNIIGRPFWNNRERVKAEQGLGNVKPLDVPSGFEEVPNLIRGKILCGYNNHNYDDKVLFAMMNEAMNLQSVIYSVSNTVISGKGKQLASIGNQTIDCMQQIDVSHPSLKQIEGNMGKSIIETSTSFDIDRPLTDEEREVMAFYCAYDVENTIEIYKLRKKSYFEVKESLVTMLPESAQEGAMKRNTTTISAQILTGKKKATIWSRHGIPEKFWCDSFRETSGISKEVWDMWDEVTASPEATMEKGKSVKQKTPFGTYVFGLGGLHGAPDKPVHVGHCKHADVASMYPSAIVTLGVLDNTELYDSIRRERVSIKKSDPVRAGALKLVLNSVYGLLKSEYSTLYSPLSSSTICIYGQIALFTLCKRLYESGYDIINANTDGVVYVDTPKSLGNDEEILRNWEDTFKGFKLESEEYREWHQKDVNNYVAVETDGNIIVKGGEVSKFKENKFFSNNSCRVTQIVLVEKLLHPEKNVVALLRSHLNEPILWQFILKAGSTFAGVVDKSGEYQQKVNRVFAAAPDEFCTLESTKLYKVKTGPNREEILINFPDVPERMILWNDDVNKMPDFGKNIDIHFYAELVTKKLKGWGDVR